MKQLLMPKLLKTFSTTAFKMKRLYSRRKLRKALRNTWREKEVMGFKK
jgi:hypothetical protein